MPSCITAFNCFLNFPPSTLLRFYSGQQAGFDLGMRNGVVVAVPNPSPMDGGADVDAAIRLALVEANEKGLIGRDVTPFVLASVNDITGGQSLKSNVALVRATVVGSAYRFFFPHRAVRWEVPLVRNTWSAFMKRKMLADGFPRWMGLKRVSAIVCGSVLRCRRVKSTLQ